MAIKESTKIRTIQTVKQSNNQTVKQSNSQTVLTVKQPSPPSRQLIYQFLIKQVYFKQAKVELFNFIVIISTVFSLFELYKHKISPGAITEGFIRISFMSLLTSF